MFLTVFKKEVLNWFVCFFFILRDFFLIYEPIATIIFLSKRDTGVVAINFEEHMSPLNVTNKQVLKSIYA